MMLHPDDFAEIEKIFRKIANEMKEADKANEKEAKSAKKGEK